MNSLLATEHSADLLRAADRRRASRRQPRAAGSAVARMPALVIRLAEAGDAPAVRELAALDDAAALDGPILLALVDGQAVAALSLLDRRAAANPFLATADVVALLRLRSGQRPAPSRRGRLRTALRPRFA